MNNILEDYQKLCARSTAAIVPGTSVPGHGVAADAIKARDVNGTETFGVRSDTVASAVIGANTTGSTTDSIDAKTMLASPESDGIKADAVDPKSMSTGEKTEGVGEGAGGKDNNENKVPESPATADTFSDEPQRVQAFLLAEEVAGKVEIIKNDSDRFYYDKADKVSPRIINKPSAKGGNVTKLVRDNTKKSRRPYVSDTIAAAVHSWWLDDDDFFKTVDKFDLPHLVLFNNGIFDLAENCFIKGDAHALGYYFSTRVNADYTVKPLVPLSLEFYENVCIEGAELVLGANGILLSNVRDLKKAFFFPGPRNSGKTTMANNTQYLLIPKSKLVVRAMPLSRLGGRFSPAELVDAHYSWAGDIGATEFTRSAFDNFKILTGGDSFEFEKKFKDPSRSEPKCALAFNCNKFPRFPLAWDYDGVNIDEGAGRGRIVLFHTRKTFTEEMIVDYKREHGMKVEEVLKADKDAIASEMIRQAGRIYRGEQYFPKAAFDEVYCEGKSLKERFFYFVKTHYEPTGNPADLVPLQKIIAGYKEAHPDELLPYRDAISEQRAFGALLNYVSYLDKSFMQTKKQMDGYPNPVSCLVGCKRKPSFQEYKRTDS